MAGSVHLGLVFQMVINRRQDSHNCSTIPGGARLGLVWGVFLFFFIFICVFLVPVLIAVRVRTLRYFGSLGSVPI